MDFEVNPVGTGKALAACRAALEASRNFFHHLMAPSLDGKPVHHPECPPCLWLDGVLNSVPQECIKPPVEPATGRRSMEADDPERWEIGIRNIVTILLGPDKPFEVRDIVERVRELLRRRNIILGELEETKAAMRNVQFQFLTKEEECNRLIAQRGKDIIRLDTAWAEVVHLRDELAKAREAARLIYRPDGSTKKVSTPEEAVAFRIESAKKIASHEATIDSLRASLRGQHERENLLRGDHQLQLVELNARLRCAHEELEALRGAGDFMVPAQELELKVNERGGIAMSNLTQLDLEVGVTAIFRRVCAPAVKG